jgi:AraC-like DNA-binding protein
VMNIARKAGFRSPIYFCRWIRKHTGMTPEELRRAPLA